MNEQKTLMRVLFVDDEVNVLHAMRRSFHCMRHEWTMEFVSSGAEALQSLASFPADVIVTDMRMPGMDGWELLAKVKELYPQTVRLVLSGYAEPGAIMRLVGTAHQYIAKPGESAALKAAIAQTLLMRSILNDPALARLVGEVGTLPSIPTAFLQISQCLRQPNSNLADAAQIIRRDVAMTANIMKMVNSAFFGARRQVNTVDRAVAYLGWETLTALVLGHGLFKGSETRDTEMLWEHSLNTAMAARAIGICEQLPELQLEEAFLAGMLHDIGRVVLATLDPKTGARGARSTQTEAVRLDDRRPGDDHHDEVGAYLLGLWGFPTQIVAAVALHDTPSRRTGARLDLTVLLHVADRLAKTQGNELIPPEELGIEAGLLEGLGLVDRLAVWRAAVSASDAAQKTATAG